jgi:hypothetical protein
LPSLISVIERILPDGTRRHTAYRESTPEHPDAYFFYGPGSPEALSYQKQVNHLGTLALTAETTNEELLLLI